MFSDGKFVVIIAAVMVVFAGGPGASAGDWPMWRYDANRSAASPHELPAELHLQWTRQYPALKPAWEDPVNQDRMPFDRVYEPVVVGETLLIGSSRSDKVTALDTRTGREKWRFYADGPVRFAPALWRDKVYFVSDDGYLYCVDVGTGALAWKVRGGPGGRKVLGNSRLISAWPGRGGAVVKDGIVYFGASIWPFMGTFIHAVDAETGRAVWTNDGLGSTYVNQPHGGSVSFGGVAPQGALVAVGDKLIVPTGRSVPACLDRTTGELLYYHLSGSQYRKTGQRPSSKLEGGSHACAIGDFFFNHRGLNTSMYDLATGQMYVMWRGTTYPVLTDDVCYFSGNPVVARRLKDLKLVGYDAKVKDRKTGQSKTVKKHRWELPDLWRCQVDGTGSLIKAGGRLYAGGENVVSALEVSGGGEPEVVWTRDIEGTAARIIAADDRLFVVTPEGRIYAFGAAARDPKEYLSESVAASCSDEMSALVEGILKQVSVGKGYCLAFGLDEGRLVEAVARNGELRVVAVDSEPGKVAALRGRFDAAGIYGSRITVHVGDATTFEAPPYLAALTIIADLEAAGLNKGEAFVKSVFKSMRPYGGVAYVRIGNESERMALTVLLAEADLPGLKVAHGDDHVLLTREGPLPGSADWTHQYGDIANTAKSDDRLVRPPLGLLWFGGSSHHDVLPRHGHGPPEQVIGGRLFIEGINSLSARDVYTGQVLWKRALADLGTFDIYYDKTYRDDPLDTSYNQIHIAGANARGTNYVAAPDKVYLLVGGECLVLDPATGKTITTVSLPADPDVSEKAAWGYIGVYEDLLIAGSQFVRFSQRYELKGEGIPSKERPWRKFDSTSSQKLVVMDRHSGRELWSRVSKYAFRHNAIAVGAGKLFCIDSVPQPVVERLKRRGETLDVESELLALDVRTGQIVWRQREDVFGTWLGYSKEHDILIQSGRKSRDMILGEPSNRMIAYRGASGAVLWDKPVDHSGPCMLHGDTIFLNAYSRKGSAVSLLTGEPKMRRHPLTGRQIRWVYHRTYGCNSVVASEHLLTFRSGAAGYYDLVSDGGTGNLGGFKSGCTSNLIVANGVLNAPDYTRTCTCSYQNQTSLAVIHMPEMELWTCSTLPKPDGRVRRVGINFGAPGDRVAADGTLWLDYPSVGGPSPDIPVSVVPDEAEWFHWHSSRIKRGRMPWVAASGANGISKVTVSLADGSDSARPYTVRLHFVAPDGAMPGRRVFSVALQGREVLRDFDVAAAAGGPNRAVVKEFTTVGVQDALVVEFAPAEAAVICGIEAVAEGW